MNMLICNLKYIKTCTRHVTYFEYGEREALPLKEAGDQLNQVVKGAAGKVGQLPELVP